MKHINKVRLFNQCDNTYRYPDETGHFYVHHVGSMIVWDNNEIWQSPYLFSFVPSAIQRCFGKVDKNGQEIYVGKLMVMEVSSVLFQHTIWEAAVNY
jgi:hypothetical protein